MAFRKGTVENMGLDHFWAGRRVFVTGHTGFKGAWLCLWLEKLGAHVFATSLPANTSPSLHNLLTVERKTDGSIVDIRDVSDLTASLLRAQPEIVIHLAAQALVRHSYRDPINTYSTNVMGTVNLLEAAKLADSVKTVLVVTTDKVYANNGAGIPFVETDPLGGEDPYSNSKAAVELVCQSYRHSFFAQRGIRLATVRAGNVIGGGDWSEDRLVPDFIRALEAHQTIMLRYPYAIRPWQHVLEPLRGYMTFAQLLTEGKVSLPQALNFGPNPQNFATVSQVVDTLAAIGSNPTPWQQDPGEHPQEASFLTLNSSLAKETIGWEPFLDLNQTLSWTLAWYKNFQLGADMYEFSLKQITDYEDIIESRYS